MKLIDIFQKPVSRPIEGVIKADDETQLLLEIEEYVLTNEVSKRIENFLEEYVHYSGANGAWISGFFGSGKSHLLKVLALLLENRQLDGSSVADILLHKVEGNAMLKGLIQKTISIPSHSILFNIDQQADVIKNTEAEALLSVFMKVFNNTCGYYGQQGYIAQFERDLDTANLYDKFRGAYREISGLDWNVGRTRAGIEKANIDRAYSQATGESSVKNGGILDSYRKDYKVSIADFAKLVNDYIQKQEPGFRLNFFVDEAGQFIANNIRLMTNLQTIVESLSTICKGRAWLIVTAQEDLNSIIGPMQAQAENDFTKIQDRFKIRLKLTSRNVDEVIQRRLLTKNTQGETLCEAIYRQEVNNFGTLFDFTDGGVKYKNYTSQQNFVESYPFVSYQFGLFQSAIQNLSLRAAFEGRHSSVGERSMLGVFQEVVKKISEKEVGQLATFDLMYEGISTALKAQIQQAIFTAHSNLDNLLAIQLLKALFLVKYIKEFKSNLHNLTVLMYDHFGQDLNQLHRNVEEALNLLVQQSYIQRNGDLYEYLTNEEKDIEVEIKHTEVDADSITSELGKVIFDNIIKDRKIRHDDLDIDYSFSRKLDDSLLGREFELAIHIASPFNVHIGSEETLRMHSMGRDELLVILPPDARLIEDLLMFKRTEKYILQNSSSAQTESITRILTEKGLQNRDRLRHVETRLRELIIQAKFYVGGSQVTLTSNDPQTRIITAFRELIRVTYPNLRMLHGISYDESQIESYLRSNEPSLLQEPTAHDEAANELLIAIEGNQRNGTRTTMKSLVEKFERKPYGWPLAAVQCNLAKLVARSKLELRLDGNLLEDAALVRALRNTQQHPNLILEPQIQFTAAQVRGLKEFFEDFFDQPPAASEPRDLGKETAIKLDERRRQLEELVRSEGLYPFYNELNQPISRLKEVTAKAYPFYFTDLPRYRDELLELKERVITPIQAFASGPQRSLFDNARTFYQREHPNFDKVEGNESVLLGQMIQSRTLINGGQFNQLAVLMNTLQAKIQQVLIQEREAAAKAGKEMQARLERMSDFALLTPEQQNQIRDHFVAFFESIEHQTLIAVVRDNLQRFTDRDYPALLGKVSTFARLNQQPEQPPAGGIAEPGVTYVPRQKIPVPFDKAYLENEDDLERYLDLERSVLLQHLKAGKRVQI